MDDRANPDTPLPASVTVDFQPYGKEIIGDLRFGSYNGFPTLEGTVIEGTETSRLFQFTKTRSTAGERRTVYGIRQHELDGRVVVRVAM